MTWKLAALAVLVAVGIGLQSVPAADPPRPSMAEKDWKLKFSYEAPRPILVQIPGKAQPELFWYMLYRVTNHTGDDQLFVPEVDLYTKTGQLLRSGQGVDPIVFDTIKKLHGNPLLVDQASATGKILVGEENAKDSVAIFRNFDAKAASFSIFFSGLSGETAVVTLPQPVSVTEIGPGGKLVQVQKDEILLTKTLKLDYAINTDASSRASAKSRELNKSWVMR